MNVDALKIVVTMDCEIMPRPLAVGRRLASQSPLALSGQSESCVSSCIRDLVGPSRKASHNRPSAGHGKAN
jgi:hypothetical protein